MSSSRSIATLVMLSASMGCSAATSGSPAAVAPAPWDGPMLEAEAVPQVYHEVWATADNRAGCALIAFSAPDSGASATARAATFSGGWGVAYDLPGVRSAFGVAGAGVTTDQATYQGWPRTVTWRDGSRAGYGPEGGTGPNQLAYLQIRGQACLYNVWSRLGIAHLERLLQQLRFVARLT